MSLFAKLYDPLMLPLEQSILKKWRRELLQKVRGDVLEIGVGTGRNLPFMILPSGGGALSLIPRCAAWLNSV